jgi:hypothetical protein
MSGNMENGRKISNVKEGNEENRNEIKKRERAGREEANKKEPGIVLLTVESCSLAQRVSLFVLRIAEKHFALSECMLTTYSATERGRNWESK